MQDKPIAVVDDARFDAHRARGSHPERPERLAAARAGLDAAIPAERRTVIGLLVPAEEALAAVHRPGYLRALDEALETGWGLLDPDTYFSPGTRDATRSAAGAAMELARAIVRGEARAGVALVRPPGHHATPERAMGFCLLNNIALAAKAALAEGAERVAIVDWDVHHGNGTQAAFEDDPRVLFVSTHQWPFYPGTGAPTSIGSGEGAGFSANVALPAGSGPEAYGEAFRRVVLPLLDAFDPSVTLVSAGFDGHARDPLAGHELDADTYGAMATALLRRGDVGFFLEGGYDLRALEDSIRAVGRAIEGETTELPEDVVPGRVREALDVTVGALAARWPGVL
jgi:acetoin utilization deacetylase AcuC-like enzyme